jgi:hypothetical protein
MLPQVTVVGKRLSAKERAEEAEARKLMAEYAERIRSGDDTPKQSELDEVASRLKIGNGESYTDFGFLVGLNRFYQYYGQEERNQIILSDMETMSPLRKLEYFWMSVDEVLQWIPWFTHSAGDPPEACQLIRARHFDHPDNWVQVYADGEATGLWSASTFHWPEGLFLRRLRLRGESASTSFG